MYNVEKNRPWQAEVSKPWESFGTKVNPNDAPQEMLEKAGLAWGVKKVPNYVHLREKGKFAKTIPTGGYTLIRDSDNSVLSPYIGDEWEPVQNIEAFESITEFVRSAGMKMDTVGSIRNGQYVWALVKVGESFDVGLGDIVDSYMLVTVPHVYGKSLDLRLTPIRRISNNTLIFPLGENSGAVSYSTAHNNGINPAKAARVLEKARSKFGEYHEVADFLVSKKFNTKMLLEYCSKIFPKTSGKTVVRGFDDLSRNAQEAYRLVSYQPGFDLSPETAWQALNSVIYVIDHIQGHNAENRLYNQWWGYNVQRKQRAMKLALQIAENS